MSGPGTSPSGPFFWTRLRLNAHGWPRLPWNRAWRADLSAYADDELDPGERARVQAQLDASPERQQWLTEIEHVQETLAALSAAELPRSFELNELQFAAARTADSEPIDERASAARAIPLRLATAGAVASLVALATVSGFDMLDNPTTTTPAITRIEPTATAVTTGADAVQSAAESPAVPAAASESEPAAIAAAPSDQAEESAAAAQSQQPEPAAAEAAVEEAEEEEQAEQAALEQAQYEQQAAQQAEQQHAEDTPPAMTAEQQEAARDPARGAVNAGISAGQSQSDSANPAFSARDDSDDQADHADDAATDAAEPAPESQTGQAAETEDQPAATSDAAVEADQPDDPQPSRVIVVSTSGQADQDTRRISIPDTGQQTVRRNPEHSADPDDWPIPARPQAAGETRAAEPGWETPVQIALAVVAIVALLIWIFCWLVARRQAL